MRKSSGTHHDAKKPLRHEDCHGVSRSKSEEKRIQRRREWLIQLEREREHEKLKKKMILEYEIRRAREKGLPLPKQRSSHRSRSKSRSRSAESQHRRSFSGRSKPTVMSEKVESSTKISIFKSPEGATQIDASELRKIKVDIHRNIPVNGPSTSKLERDIINPEDVVVKRRDGEGSKPIFEREELKRASDKFEEIEEHRIVSVNSASSAVKSDKSERRSASVSPLRKRNHSPRRTSSRHSRREDLKHKHDLNDYHSTRKYSRERDHSRDESRERKERYRNESRHRSPAYNTEDSYSRQRRSHHTSRDRSREREQRIWDRDSNRSKDGRSHREYREKSRDRSRERRENERERERERSRERRPPPPHYVEQVPVPVYYGNFPPRPIVVGPIIPFRGQLPMPRGRPLLGPIRPFHPPRFTPPDMYRIGLPPNPRFGPMF